MGDRQFRELLVPPKAASMRLDRFLALWFPDWSRASLVRGIKAGEVTDAQDQPLRPSTILRGGECIRLRVAGLAPGAPPPPLPQILHEDDRILVFNKPAGLLAHPAGQSFSWSLIGLCRQHWPKAKLDLVHRLDRDTSGVLVVSKDKEANSFLKAAFKNRACIKEYDAITRGVPPWNHRELTGPIGPSEGIIRIKMAVRPDGLPAHTGVDVVQRRAGPPALARIRCRLHTGRTHQIRLHLAHEGFPLLGDRMYGVPPDVFLRVLETGADEETYAQTGAPRQALHGARIVISHPDGHELDVKCPLAPDMESWWTELQDQGTR
ncbi:MAG: RluA family pseudouridine synthase [Proteobacteria bacterium]|jgi:23S rRNA pseudouridine1911/1915/1917 synthase|nr:RluA family pseudouridine synthase [Pseudomonadota bacterium]